MSGKWFKRFAALCFFIGLSGTLAAAPADGKSSQVSNVKFDRYELSILYDATGYFTLSVFEKSADGAETETVYGLRRASMYLPPAYKSGDWMLFFGERPPAYEGRGLSAVSKDPWLVSTAGGVWSVTRVPHASGKNGVYTLLRVQPGKGGSPELVYLNGDGDEDPASPDGWAEDSKLVTRPDKPIRVKKITFVPK